MASAHENPESPALTRGFFDDGDPRGRLYLLPVGLRPYGRGAAHRLAGGWMAFSACAVIVRGQDGLRQAVAPIGRIRAWAEDEGAGVAERITTLLHRLTAPRPPFAGLAPDRPRVMGIVNATPDSFFDRGAHADPATAVAHGRTLAAAGADVVDVGAESTRPGADPVTAGEELSRLLPVLRGLRDCGAVLSVDTYKAPVMAAALAEGAAIVNDVSALTGDADALATVAEAGTPVILGHMQGTPKTMNVAPAYAHAPLDVFDALEARVEACLRAGIERARLAVDPGFGFGKTPAHNTEILDWLALLHGLGCAVVVGASHKAFEARVARLAPRPAPASPSLAAALAAAARGAHLLRVHDVAGTLRALDAWSGGCRSAGASYGFR